MIKSLIAVTLVLGSTAVLCQAPGLLSKEVFTLDCNGRIHIAPGTPFEMHIEMTKLARAYNFFLQMVEERVKCKCPAISERNFERQYVFGVESFLSHALPERLDDTCPSQVNSDPNAVDTDYVAKFVNLANFTDFTLPDTCQLDGYLSGKPCSFKYSVGGAQLGLIVDRCPEETLGRKNRIPFVSVSCSGNGCSQLFKPCSDSTACGGNLQCFDLSQGAGPFTSETYSQFLLNSGIFYAPSGSCSVTPTSFFSSIVKKLMVDSFGLSASDASFSWAYPGICLPPTDEFETIQDENGRLVAASDWDGKLSDGTMANSAERKKGKSLPTSGVSFADNVVVLFSLDCNGVFGLLPNMLDLKFHLPTLSPWLTHINSVINQVRSCDSSWTSTLQRTLFQLYQPNGFLYKFTKINPFSTGKWTTSAIDKIFASLGSSTFRVNTPSTCKFEQYDQKGCSASYTHLTSLLDQNLKIHLKIARCGNMPEGLPSFYVTCEGKLCNSLHNMQMCNSDSDCATGSVCFDILKQIGTDRDLVDFALGSSQDCKSDPATKGRDAGELLKIFQTKFRPPSGGLQGIKICTADFASKMNKAGSWASSAYVNQGDTLVVSNLRDYEGPKMRHDPSAPSSAASTNRGVTLVLLVVGSVVTLLSLVVM